MHSRSLTTTLLALMLAHSATCQASAASLHWSNGAHDKDVVDAASCTLFVSIPQSSLGSPAFSLVWGSSSSTGLTLSSLANPGANGDTLTPSLYEPANSASGLLAHTDTLRVWAHDIHSNTMTCALIVTPADVAAHFFLILDGQSDGIPVADATLNDGSQLPPPPMISAAYAELNSGIRISVSGIGLAAVDSVFLCDETTGARTQVLSPSVEGSSLKFTVPAGSSLAYPYVLAISEAGNAACRIAGTPAAETELLSTPPPPQVLLHLAYGLCVPDPTVSTDASHAGVRSSPRAFLTRLSSAGVTELRPLFPEASIPSDPAYNYLGERIQTVDLRAYVVGRVAATTSIAAVVAALTTDSSLVAADSIGQIGAYYDPNDPLFTKQIGLRSVASAPCGVTNGATNIQAQSAWAIQFGVPDVRVGILDTGIDVGHPDLKHAILAASFASSEPDLADNSTARHGTAVAGIACAQGNDGRGIAGVAMSNLAGRAATPVSIKMLNALGGGIATDGAAAIEYAATHGCSIINCSWGAPVARSDDPNPAAPAPADIDAYRAATFHAFLLGALVVAAAGNAYTGLADPNTPNDPFFDAYPAAFTQRTLAVGAVDLYGQRWRDWSYYHCPYAGQCVASNYGAWLDYLAPGGRFIVTDKNSSGPDSFYTYDSCVLNAMNLTAGFSGTSASAPFVSGIAALLKSANYSLLGEDIDHILRHAAAYQGQFQYPPDDQNGYGYLSAQQALLYLLGTHTYRKRVEHAQLSALTIADSTATLLPVLFKNNSFLGTATYSCRRYHMTATAAFRYSFSNLPDVWCRGSGTIGAKDTLEIDDNYEIPFSRPRAGSLSLAGCTYDTYVYRVNLPGGTSYWYPTDPAGSRIAYTAIGYTLNGVGVEPAGDERRIALSINQNPVRSGAVLTIEAPRGALARVDLLDIAGRVVAHAFEGRSDGRRQEVRWNGVLSTGSRAPAGVYWARLATEAEFVTRKFIVLN